MRKLKSLETIQALRAFAALAVVMDHIPFVSVGGFGVDVFFIISGFIVCYITREDTEHFMLKRIFRIVPLYWGATLLVFLVALLKPALLQSTSANFGELLKSLFFIPYTRENGLDQPILFLGWSLNFEMFFYVIFGACLAASRRRAPLLCAGAMLLLYGIGQSLPLPMPLRFWLGTNVLEFIGGIAIFHLFWNAPKIIQAPPRLVNFAVMAVAFAAMIAATLQSRGEQHNVLLFGALALFLVAATLGLEGRTSIPAFIVVIGDASYSLYLLHPYLLRMVQKFVDPMQQPSLRAMIGAAIFIAAALGVAWLSFRLVERPSNHLLRRMLRRDGHIKPVVEQTR